MRFATTIFCLMASFIKKLMGVAIGSRSGPSLANTFLAQYEQICLNNCPDEFKPVYYKRYVDVIFVLFPSLHHLGRFNEYLNRKKSVF